MYSRLQRPPGSLQGPLPFDATRATAVIGLAVSDAQAMTGNYDGPLCPTGGASCWPSIAQV